MDIAVNHDPAAVLMHKTNHPYTWHYCEDIFAVDPREAVAGRHVQWAHFSPDCKHFSKAKGGKPVDKKIRGLAWIVLKWAALVKPDIISLENVEEFRTWGPVKRGRPVKAHTGETFRRWKSQLEALGYVVEHRELVACDYGAPTSRKRFFLIARSDGKPIHWPTPTHGDPESDAVKSGKLKPWRAAAEIIDWSLPCPSVFDTATEIKDRYGLKAQRPLADTTMQRIGRGLKKFVLKTGKPFIIQSKFSNPPQSAGRPLTVITAVNAHELIAPSLIQYHSGEDARGQILTDPLMTVDAAPRYALSVAYLSEYYGNAQEGLSPDQPLRTVTSKDREGVTLVYLSKWYNTCTGQTLWEPLHTVTTSPGHFALVTVKVSPDRGDLGHWPEVRALLNQCCGYNLDANEILLLLIAGVAYYIADIGLRMLTPRELFNAQGFPSDYIIDRDYTGKEYSKTKQVARAGNAVPPQFAAALVRANAPERCVQGIETMGALNGRIAI